MQQLYFNLNVQLIQITQAIELHCAFSAFVFWANRSAGVRGSFFLFNSIPIRSLVLFQVFTQAEIQAPGRVTAFLFQSPETKCQSPEKTGRHQSTALQVIRGVGTFLCPSHKLSYIVNSALWTLVICTLSISLSQLCDNCRHRTLFKL